MNVMAVDRPRSPSDANFALHHLRATPETCHWGYFSAAQPPALRVNSGDLIWAESVTQHAGDAPDLLMDEGIRALYAGIPQSMRGPGVHVLTGPVFVKGAEPGDMLEVRYLSMEPRLGYGSNLAGNWGYLYNEMGKTERATIFKFDANSQTAEAVFAYDVAEKYQTPGRITPPESVKREPALPGVRIPIRPHLGTAGVAPAGSEKVSTVPPGRHGGNVDNWRIAAGSTMFYPVAVEGALFSIGDSHMAQGDGELNGTAIEASLNVLYQVVVRKDMRLPSPLLETPQDWVVHGFGATIDAAMRDAALQGMHFLTERQNLSRNDAYALMSVAVDFGITQVVDGVVGVHGRIPRSMFSSRNAL